MAAQANRLEVFLHTHVERSGAELRPQKADSRDPLVALLGLDGPARVADPLGQLAFVVRWERGEIGGLPHCHILISRFPEPSINPSTCFAMINTWKHGIAHIRLFDPYAAGDVSKYICKGRFSSAADCEGANTYELRKFNRADWIYQSRRLGGNTRSSDGGHENVAASVECSIAILYDIYCLMLLKSWSRK